VGLQADQSRGFVEMECHRKTVFIPCGRRSSGCAESGGKGVEQKNSAPRLTQRKRADTNLDGLPNVFLDVHDGRDMQGPGYKTR